jgi:AcrR family transcriptional regulator
VPAPTKPKSSGAPSKSLKANYSTKSVERRREIVQAAYQTLAEKGFEGLRMREIAKKAGIDHSTLHYYFAGKAALVDGIVDHIVHDLAIGRSSVSERENINASQRLSAHFEVLMQQLRNRPEMFVVLAELQARSMREPAIRSIFAKNDRSWKKFLVEILEAGIQQRAFDEKLEPEVAAETIIALVRGLSTTFAGRTELMKRPFQQLLSWLKGNH